MNALLPPHDTEQFECTGLQRVDSALPAHLLRFLRTESTRFAAQIAVPRPWHYAELHNPWAHAAATFDSWGFLDICQSPILIEALAKLIGPDIVLFDSQWLPHRWQSRDIQSTLESDAHRFPVDPPSGLTVIIGVASTSRGTVRVEYRPTHLGSGVGRRANASLDLEAGTVLIVDSRVPYRVSSACESSVPSAYAVRYFPASSRYSRDPAIPVHRALTERYPLLNYARLPLWLVHGQDHARNDFVTGFNVRAGYWTNAKW